MTTSVLLFKTLSDGVLVRLRQDYEHGESELTTMAHGFKLDAKDKVVYFTKERHEYQYDTSCPEGEYKFAVKYDGEDLSKRTFLPFV